MASKNTNKGTARTRTYATAVYPDSAPENWLELLTDCKVPAFVSPLHDKDINPDGEPKKPHWHVMIMFEGPKTPLQAREIFDCISGVGCEAINSLRGMARYFCHLDNPEKARYPIEEVKCLCGSDYLACISLATDRYAALGEMVDFCDKYNVVSFYALSKYARLYRPDWHRILADSGSVYMREHLRSKLWSEENNCCSIVDPETGEVIL